MGRAEARLQEVIPLHSVTAPRSPQDRPPKETQGGARETQANGAEERRGSPKPITTPLPREPPKLPVRDGTSWANHFKVAGKTSALLNVSQQKVPRRPAKELKADHRQYPLRRGTPEHDTPEQAQLLQPTFMNGP